MEVNVKIRPAREADRPVLFNLWETVFGDSKGAIDAFFDRAYDEALVLEADEAVVSAVYTMPLGALETADGGRLPCGVSYAFATFPAARGLGYGARLANTAAEGLEARGQLALICPAEDSLFGYYAGKTGYRDWFYVNERVLTAPPQVEKPAQRVSPGVYGAARARLLSGRAHVVFSERYLDYQAFLCGTDGGLFCYDGGCFAVELAPDGRAFVKELLTEAPEMYDRALGVVAATVPAAHYVVRAPARGDGFDRRFAMLRGQDAPAGLPPWYGFAFD